MNIGAKIVTYVLTGPSYAMAIGIVSEEMMRLCVTLKSVQRNVCVLEGITFVTVGP